jgi:hypothetical protein
MFEIKFVLYVTALIAVSYYIGRRHGLLLGIIDQLDQIVIMKMLEKNPKQKRTKIKWPPKNKKLN